MTADELLRTLDVFRQSKFRRANWSRAATAFRTLCHVTGINFLYQPVHACPVSILPGKLPQQTSWASSSSSAGLNPSSTRDRLCWSFPYLTTPLKYVTYYGYCNSLDGATLIFNIDSNKLRRNVENGITLICAKFCADLINTSKVTGRKTKRSRFIGLPYMFSGSNLQDLHDIGPTF